MAENAVETTRVLVVSRETTLLRLLWSVGDSNSWHLENVASGWEAMERVRGDASPHMLLLDLPRGDGDSLHLLRWLRRLRPDLPVFVICHADDASTQKEATRLGAEAVLTRPLDQHQLDLVFRRHLDASADTEADIASDHVEPVGEDECFLSISPVMQKVHTQAELLAQADVPVLIVGEDGTGKSTVARLIHKLSVHSGFDFQTVNCAALPGPLLELELFGKTNSSVRGAEICRISPGKLALAEHACEEAALIRPLLDYFPPQVDFDGVDFSTTVRTSEGAQAEAVEYFLPYRMMRCFASYDCTGQQLLDSGTIVIDGERSALDLQIAEGKN
jgi:DNA-binding NtrC family response regulator